MRYRWMSAETNNPSVLSFAEASAVSSSIRKTHTEERNVFIRMGGGTDYSIAAEVRVAYMMSAYSNYIVRYTFRTTKNLWQKPS